MAEIDFFEKAQEAVKNPGHLSQTAKDYIKQNASDFAVSRSRLMKAAIREWDEDQMLSILKEIAILTGPKNAYEYFLYKMGEVVNEGQESPAPFSDYS